MIKADSSSLQGLNQKLTRQLDDYCKEISRIFKLKETLSNSWSQAQMGSFEAVMEKIQGCKFDVETEIMEVRKLISEMIQAADSYNNIRF